MRAPAPTASRAAPSSTRSRGLGPRPRTSSSSPAMDTRHAATRIIAASSASLSHPGSSSEHSTALTAIDTPPRYGVGSRCTLPGSGASQIPLASANRRQSGTSATTSRKASTPALTTRHPFDMPLPALTCRSRESYPASCPLALSHLATRDAERFQSVQAPHYSALSVGFLPLFARLHQEKKLCTKLTHAHFTDRRHTPRTDRPLTD